MASNGESFEHSKPRTKISKRSIFDYTTVEDLNERSLLDTSSFCSSEKRFSAGNLPFNESYITYAPKTFSISPGRRYALCGRNVINLSSKSGSVENLVNDMAPHSKIGKTKFNKLSKSTPNLSGTYFLRKIDSSKDDVQTKKANSITNHEDEIDANADSSPENFQIKPRNSAQEVLEQIDGPIQDYRTVSSSSLARESVRITMKTTSCLNLSGMKELRSKEENKVKKIESKNDLVSTPELVPETCPCSELNGEGKQTDANCSNASATLSEQKNVKTEQDPDIAPRRSNVEELHNQAIVVKTIPLESSPVTTFPRSFVGPEPNVTNRETTFKPTALTSYVNNNESCQVKEPKTNNIDVTESKESKLQSKTPKQTTGFKKPVINNDSSKILKMDTLVDLESDFQRQIHHQYEMVDESADKMLDKEFTFEALNHELTQIEKENCFDLQEGSPIDFSKDHKSFISEKPSQLWTDNDEYRNHDLKEKSSDSRSSANYMKKFSDFNSPDFDGSEFLNDISENKNEPFDHPEKFTLLKTISSSTLDTSGKSYEPKINQFVQTGNLLCTECTHDESTGPEDRVISQHGTNDLGPHDLAHIARVPSTSRTSIRKSEPISEQLESNRNVLEPESNNSPPSIQSETEADTHPRCLVTVDHEKVASEATKNSKFPLHSTQENPNRESQGLLNNVSTYDANNNVTASVVVRELETQLNGKTEELRSNHGKAASEPIDCFYSKNVSKTSAVPEKLLLFQEEGNTDDESSMVRNKQETFKPKVFGSNLKVNRNKLSQVLIIFPQTTNDLLKLDQQPGIPSLEISDSVVHATASSRDTIFVTIRKIILEPRDDLYLKTEKTLIPKESNIHTSPKEQRLTQDVIDNGKEESDRKFDVPQHGTILFDQTEETTVEKIHVQAAYKEGLSTIDIQNTFSPNQDNSLVPYEQSPRELEDPEPFMEKVTSPDQQCKSQKISFAKNTPTHDVMHINNEVTESSMEPMKTSVQRKDECLLRCSADNEDKVELVCLMGDQKEIAIIEPTNSAREEARTYSETKTKFYENDDFNEPKHMENFLHAILPPHDEHKDSIAKEMSTEIRKIDFKVNGSENLELDQNLVNFVPPPVEDLEPTLQRDPETPNKSKPESISHSSTDMSAVIFTDSLTDTKSLQLGNQEFSQFLDGKDSSDSVLPPKLSGCPQELTEDALMLDDHSSTSSYSEKSSKDPSEGTSACKSKCDSNFHETFVESGIAATGKSTSDDGILAEDCRVTFESSSSPRGQLTLEIMSSSTEENVMSELTPGVYCETDFPSSQFSNSSTERREPLSHGKVHSHNLGFSNNEIEDDGFSILINPAKDTVVQMETNTETSSYLKQMRTNPRPRSPVFEIQEFQPPYKRQRTTNQDFLIVESNKSLCSTDSSLAFMNSALSNTFVHQTPGNLELNKEEFSVTQGYSSTDKKKFFSNTALTTNDPFSPAEFSPHENIQLNFGQETYTKSQTCKMGTSLPETEYSSYSSSVFLDEQYSPDSMENVRKPLHTYEVHRSSPFQEIFRKPSTRSETEASSINCESPEKPSSSLRVNNFPHSPEIINQSLPTQDNHSSYLIQTIPTEFSKGDNLSSPVTISTESNAGSNDHVKAEFQSDSSTTQTGHLSERDQKTTGQEDFTVLSINENQQNDGITIDRNQPKRDVDSAKSRSFEASLNGEYDDSYNDMSRDWRKPLYRTTMEVSTQKNLVSTCYVFLQQYQAESSRTRFELVYDTDKWIAGALPDFLDEHQVGTCVVYYAKMGQVGSRHTSEASGDEEVENILTENSQLSTKGDETLKEPTVAAVTSTEISAQDGNISHPPGDEVEQENQSVLNDKDIPNDLSSKYGWQALESQTPPPTHPRNQFTRADEQQPTKTQASLPEHCFSSQLASHLYPPDSLSQLSEHTVPLHSPIPLVQLPRSINPQATLPLGSSIQKLIQCHEDNRRFKEVNLRRHHVKSHILERERVRVSRRVSVTKNSSTSVNWKYLPDTELNGDSKYEKLHTEIGEDNLTKDSDVEPIKTEESVEAIAGDDLLASPNDIFEQEITRNCSWQLNTEESIGDFIFSKNNLGATAISDDNTVLGREGFTMGQHSWVIKASGFFCAIGVCYPGKESVESSWYKGTKWVWTTDGLQYSEPKGIRRSDFGQWRSEDVLEIHLDCENSTVSMVNTTTNVVASLTGFNGKVYPYFNLYKSSHLILLETFDQ